MTETGKKPAKEDENIISIALFGTDFTENEKYGNLYGASDSTMILGIDTKNNKLKLFSLMRDLYLDLPDGSGNKQNLNYTMAYGGPELILKTINYNFNLKVDSDEVIHLKKDLTEFEKEIVKKYNIPISSQIISNESLADTFMLKQIENIIESAKDNYMDIH